MRTLRIASPLLCVAALACGDTTAPTVADVAGSYGAATFTTQDVTGTTDLLAQGTLLNIVLTADGNTTGRLLVPGGNDDGSDFDADLAGTWLLHGDTVDFEHAADTFVRDMPFLFSGGKLSGQATFSGTNVKVVLAKQ
jgi:hypothetical protein